MSENIRWQDPWEKLCVEPLFFDKQLYKEVGENHILYGKMVTALGRRGDCDDVLFKVNDSEFGYAVVHLTYSSNKEKNGNYPTTKVYSDLNDWIERCMIPNHTEYILGEED